MAKRKTSKEILSELAAEDDGRPSRPIGPWSLEKLATLLLYFEAFTTACKSVGGGYYVDALAGPGMCEVRGALFQQARVWGSPLIALRTEPKFQTCIFVEKKEDTARTLHARVESFGTRASVHQGDVNEELPRIISQDVPRGAPCFCLLDPEALEVHWSTIEQIARTPRRARKPELLILFPLKTALVRQLAVLKPMTDAGFERVSRFFSTQAWRDIHQARKEEEISPPEALVRYLDLYCADLKALGYGWVLSKRIAIPAKPGGRNRRELYHLVFATDHEAGDRIMRNVFRRPYALDFLVTGQKPLNI
ncbi:MAG: three-Cys-motif partner protein TcmP [Chloroflexi bacterium]|nr:three-Cys-motif partner protein TcmP [Chloroflexota bacterium]